MCSVSLKFHSTDLGVQSQQGSTVQFGRSNEIQTYTELCPRTAYLKHTENRIPHRRYEPPLVRDVSIGLAVKSKFPFGLAEDVSSLRFPSLCDSKRSPLSPSVCPVHKNARSERGGCRRMETSTVHIPLQQQRVHRKPMARVVTEVFSSLAFSGAYMKYHNKQPKHWKISFIFSSDDFQFLNLISTH